MARHEEAHALMDNRRHTPRLPRTAFFEKVVPIVLAVMVALLVIVLLAILLWPAPIAR